MVAAAVGGAALVGGVVSSSAQSKASKKAAAAQQQSDEAGIAEQRRQFDAIQALLKPYVTTGTGALTAQQDLAGLNGINPQAAAIQALQTSPQFTSLIQQGENSILQNASATGGLRGGNTEAALAGFRPALLSAAINDQYSRLGNLSSMGLGAATETGNFGQASANNVTQLLGQIGASRAGNALTQGQAQAGYANAISGGLGLYSALGGFKPAVATSGSGIVSGGSGIKLF